MTINEAIIYAEEMAATDGNRKRQDNYIQIAEWLKDYKRMLQQEPCEDCVSREAILNSICDYVCGKDIRCVDEHICRMKKMIDDLPSVYQKPKTGHWKKIATYPLYECSKCKLESMLNTWDYCPNCGCRMVEPQESEDKE